MNAGTYCRDTLQADSKRRHTTRHTNVGIQQGTPIFTKEQLSVHMGTVRLALRLKGAFTEVRRELALGYTGARTEALKLNKERALSFMGACTEVQRELALM